MKTLLKLTIIFTLFKKIHPDGCRTNNGRLVCENVALQKGNPLAISNYKEVWSIDFNYCTIPVVPNGVFHNFDNATVIWLDNSEVRTIQPGAFKGMALLQSLHLENNGIMELQEGVFDGLGNLQSINLDENHLLKLNRKYFSNLPRLITLRLEHNNIKSIAENTFEGLPNLENIWLRDNAITHLEKNTFANLQKLIRIDLAHNYLTNINCEVFDGLGSLSVLHLDHNNITTISKNCFRALNGLKELRLNDNKLEEIDAKNLFSCLPQFTSVSLNNNTWMCNSFLKTIKVLINYKVKIIDGDTRNATNVYGIICKWNSKEFNEQIEDTVRCNGAELSNSTTIDVIVTDAPSSTTKMAEESSEMSKNNFHFDFTTEPNTNPPVFADLKQKCPTFSTTTIALLIVVVLLSIITMILSVFLCRSYRHQNSYKIKKNIAMMAL